MPKKQTPTPEPQPQPPEPIKTFQTRTNEEAVVRLRELLEEIPELRSLIIVFDWQDNLADFSPCGAWVTRQGLIDPAMINEIPGGMIQLVRMYQTQQQLALQHINRLKQVTEQCQQLATQAKDSLDAQKESLAKARETTPAELVPGAGRPDGNVGGPASTAKDRK